MTSKESPDYRIEITKQFKNDLEHWSKTNKKIAAKVLKLAESVQTDPFSGIGKPEPLKYLDSGTWSRRITQEDRFVYRVDKGVIYLLQCRYHY
jgi:toxin YoeB